MAMVGVLVMTMVGVS